jgi:hypothetical protein
MKFNTFSVFYTVLVAGVSVYGGLLVGLILGEADGLAKARHEQAQVRLKMHELGICEWAGAVFNEHKCKVTWNAKP